MGYNTRYKLEWWPTAERKDKPLCPHKPPAAAKFCAECGRPVGVEGLADIVGDYIEAHDEMNYALARDGSSGGGCKWYDHQQHVEAMSREIPGVLFHLSGEGEEAGDIWDAYALDGMVEKHEAKIVREPVPKAWARRVPSLQTGGEP